MTKIVLLTGGADNGRTLARMLHSDGLEYSLLTIGPPDPKRGKLSTPRYLARLLRRRVAGWEPLRRLWHRTRDPFPVREDYVGRCNGPRMLSALQAYDPDFILMMGGGILSAEAIQTARRGVLNAHPGLLPEIRGVDVIRHAVMRNVPVAVTLHYIDEGIDTGRVIERWLVPIEPGDTTSSIAERADLIGNLAMRWAAGRLAAGEQLASHPQLDRHPLCRSMPAEEAARADQAIAEAHALRLYEAAMEEPIARDGSELLTLFQRA